MTREMNKPEWQREWIYNERIENIEVFGINKPILMKEIIKIPKQRILNPDIADFFWATVERYKR